MVEMKLYDEKRDDFQTTIRVYLENDELKLEGYDSGKTVDEILKNGSDYEYFLALDEDNTSKLFEKLEVSDESDEQKLTTVKKSFDWGKGFADFSDYCKKNDITTSFYSWQSGF